MIRETGTHPVPFMFLLRRMGRAEREQHQDDKRATPFGVTCASTRLLSGMACSLFGVHDRKIPTQS